jgi:hypothetical protein
MLKAQAEESDALSMNLRPRYGDMGIALSGIVNRTECQRKSGLLHALFFSSGCSAAR